MTTQMLHLSRPIPRGWLDLAHVLAGAPARRRPEFALTEPTFFRSECFAEDLPAVAAPAPAPRDTLSIRTPGRVGGGLAALLFAAPVATAILGAALMLLDRLA
jgi:hypothetical protein